MKKKTIALLLALVMALGLLAGCGGNNNAPADTTTPPADTTTPADDTTAPPADDTTEPAPADTTSPEGSLPRNETLYFAGQQWGTVNSWNIIGTNQNNAMAIAGGASGYRTLMFETLYMYNPLDGKLTGLLADGDYSWNADQTEMTVKIKPAAKWSDGTPVTANDVKRTFDIGVEIANGVGSGFGPYIDAIDVVDDSTFVIKAAKNDAGQPKNPLKILDFLSGAFIVQAAWIDTVAERNNNDAVSILNDKAEDVVWSGPYTKYYDNDQIVVFIRDDNYWGQDASMWGKLPVPKYIAHTIYADNAVALNAMKAGQVDVAQLFIANVQDTWLKDGLPISTYMQEAPYGICATMPTMWYNMNIPVLAENPALRKAIAIATDYDSIIANAMTNQSPSFKEVPRSIMNPTEAEQALYDHDAVKDLQWAGNDIEGAKKLLDDAGIVDNDGDGYREWNGEKISLNVCSPNGWTDWNASCEIVAAAGQAIGLELTTYFPENSIWNTVFTDPNQTEYQMFMNSPEAATPSNPWNRANQFMGKDYVGIANNWSGNWGQYVNDEADEIIKKIPVTTDENEIKQMYTRLVEIYLTEVPSFSLMYRPSVFHAVNESVWTNFPSADDGRGIPPMVCTDGYGIAALYELELVG